MIKQLRFGMIVFTVVSMALLSACGSTSTKPLTAADILMKAQNANVRDATFTMDLTVTVSGQAIPATGSGSFVTSQKRQDQKFSLTTQGITVTIEQIIDGKDTYTKSITDDTWKKTTNAMDYSPLSYDSLANVTLVGTEMVNGYKAYHLKGTGTDTTGGNNPEEYWIRTSDFYPLKALLTTTGDTPVNGTLTFANWNMGATISLPDPSKVTAG